ncbi:hypothetical protein ACHQM5_029055 [Ranunculus cassubicifolius]
MAHYFSVVALLMFLVGVSVAQTTHTVLDTTGWAIPQGGASAYTNWAASKNFMVGDTLVFNFGTGRHDVARVTKMEFDSCTATNTIGAIVMTGPANITLNTAGEHYYICTISGHCSLGQKLAINVSGISTTADPPTSPVPTGGPIAPCPPDSMAPTSAPGPVTTPRSPPNSASMAVTANRLLLFSASLILLSDFLL